MLNSPLGQNNVFFLGNSPHHLGYRCFDKSTGKIFIARHIDFDENTFPFNHVSNTPLNFDGPLNQSSPWLQVTYHLSSSLNGSSTVSYAPLNSNSYHSPA